MRLLLHIIDEAAWRTAVDLGSYRPDSVTDEGFIHCSTPAQVLGPANALYRGQTGLVLLCIDADRVAAPIVYEDCYDTGQAFPHIYGALNLDAVVGVIRFPPNADGSFSLPALDGVARP
ncbi:MAG: DUF952 domain-containing protein [Anaerolineales bacterium]|nr:DUF952 domain-containing protein [Anaerolineales bacterium]